MTEMKLASEYRGKFNQEIAPYISTFGYNEPFAVSNPNFKMISNLDFSDFSLVDLHLNNNIEHIRFVNCRFHNFTNQGLITNIEFIECRFNDIDLYEVSIGITFLNCSVGKFAIIDSEITNVISIKNTNNKENVIETLEIRNSTFKNNFTVSNIGIHFLTISDTDFEGIFDFNNVLVKDECNFEEINFKNLALFDECIFNVNVLFKYVIFDSFSHFRGSAFNDGLDLDYSSSKQEMNFYGVKGLEKSSTSQETYRIIKNQFEKLNNKIEANKYHALELEQHRKDIKKRMFSNFKSFLKFLPDGLVSFFHWSSSNHSSSWILPLFWIFVVSCCTNFFLGNNTIDFNFDGWNNIFKYINILSKLEDFNNSYLVMTLNKVFLGYLYYQLLTAVRKDTRK